MLPKSMISPKATGYVKYTACIDSVSNGSFESDSTSASVSLKPSIKYTHIYPAK